MPVWTPDSLAQACSTQLSQGLLLPQKSPGPEESVWSMKSVGWRLLSQGEASHHSEASCWARGSLNAPACQWACNRALESLRLSFIRWMHIDTLPLAISSFHQWGWMVFSISAWIYLWGWFTGSGLPWALIGFSIGINQWMV